MEKEQMEKLGAFLNENKGKRKFTQSVDLVVNFTNIDFSKQDNRFNMELKLPNGKGKVSKVMFFSDDAGLREKAAQLGAKVVGSGELPTIATDKVKMAELLNYEMIAQAQLMPPIAKSLGQFLGPRNKMPKPLVGSDITTMMNNMSRSIFIRSKGKYLPTVHCTIGTEKMPIEEIAANADEVVSTFVKKVGKPRIKSVYLKLTMSKPMRLQ
jgi:large subunit ribosomal protein L1